MMHDLLVWGLPYGAGAQALYLLFHIAWRLDQIAKQGGAP